MQDLYGESLEKFNFVVQSAKDIAHSSGFFELSTPILEFLEIFDRNLGKESDVLKKEIYKFEDRGGDLLALRPEFTASIVRSFLQNKFKLPARIFSHGPLFRYDRPQKGRLRQFHQVNFESIGISNYVEDASIITLAYNFLNEIGLSDKFKLEINSLGSNETLKKYKNLLIDFFKENRNSLSKISLERLETNPIRILDSKEEEDQKIIKSAPDISSIYTEEEKDKFTKTLKLLKSSGIDFIINEKIVRGLDYYTGVVFEFTTHLLGSQSTILGGGRYDNLIEQMGGASVPAIGFGAGIERISLLLEHGLKKEKCLFLLPLKEENVEFCFKLFGEFLKRKVAVQILTEGNVSKRLEKVGKSDFESFAIVIGALEESRNIFKMKDLGKSLEVEGNIESLTACLKLQ